MAQGFQRLGDAVTQSIPEAAAAVLDGAKRLMPDGGNLVQTAKNASNFVINTTGAVVDSAAGTTADLINAGSGTAKLLPRVTAIVAAFVLVPKAIEFVKKCFGIKSKEEQMIDATIAIAQQNELLSAQLASGGRGAVEFDNQNAKTGHVERATSQSRQLVGAGASK
jgi:hypothetical protein